MTRWVQLCICKKYLVQCHLQWLIVCLKWNLYWGHKNMQIYRDAWLLRPSKGSTLPCLLTSVICTYVKLLDLEFVYIHCIYIYSNSLVVTVLIRMKTLCVSSSWLTSTPFARSSTRFLFGCLMSGRWEYIRTSFIWFTFFYTCFYISRYYVCVMSRSTNPYMYNINVWNRVELNFQPYCHCVTMGTMQLYFSFSVMMLAWLNYHFSDLLFNDSRNMMKHCMYTNYHVMYHVYLHVNIQRSYTRLVT